MNLKNNLLFGFKNCGQHRIKLIASTSLLTKILTDFLSVIYLINLVLKSRNESYTNTLAVIKTKTTDLLLNL